MSPDLKILAALVDTFIINLCPMEMWVTQYDNVKEVTKPTAPLPEYI